MYFSKIIPPKVYIEAFLLPKSLISKRWSLDLISSLLLESIMQGALELISTLFVDEGWGLNLCVGNYTLIKGHGVPQMCLFCLPKFAIRVEGIGKTGSCCVAWANLLSILENWRIWCCGYMEFRSFFLAM